MKINGRKLQEELIVSLKKDIYNLKRSDIIPCIAIVTLGEEDSWKAYVSQKIKLAKSLNLKPKFINLNPRSTQEVINVVNKLNNDTSVHGLIVQRPFPIEIDTERVIQSISKHKDIDGFLEHSSFDVPAWLAVKHVLTHIAGLLNFSDLQSFLSDQSILVIGKGGTAGRPTINGLKELGFNPQVIDSKTSNPELLIKNADIIISAVGKKNIVSANLIKNKSILIGIGTHVENGKLFGDFDSKSIEDKVSFYTPTPGGIGPINLAFLFKNLIRAAKAQNS